MQEISKKFLKTQFGDLSYYISTNKKTNSTILFIHGLGSNKEWFSKQYVSYSLFDYSWLVPDLLGHGDSAVSTKLTDYTMDGQAHLLRLILLKEHVTELFILAHSMGGPIAISLIEKLLEKKDSSIKISGLIYLEGNIDKGDAFFSSKIACKSYEDFADDYENFVKLYSADFHPILQKNGPFPIWCSCLDLVKVSKEEIILPRIKNIQKFPIQFIFGKLNKGRFSSETLLREKGLPIEFIPEAGHGLHIDNPKGFWKVIKNLLP